MIADRAVSFLVRPAAQAKDGRSALTSGVRPGPVAGPRPVVAILCGSCDALAVGSAVALAQTALAGSRCSVLAVWSEPSRDHEPLGALPAAHGLAARLAREGVAATAAGQLVRIALPAQPDYADTAMRRLLGLVDVPVTLVLGRPRHRALDDLLASVDRVLIAGWRGAPSGLAEMALLDAGRIARVAVSLNLQLRPATRSALMLGLPLAPRLRSRVEAALR